MSKRNIDELREHFQSGDYINFPLKNCIIRYPHLSTPDTAFDPSGEGKYKVNLIVAEDVAKDMADIGFNVKRTDDGEAFVTATRKPSLGKPEVVDEEGTPVDGGSIGNGSLCDAELTTKYWDIGSKPSQALYLEKLTITDLVVYKATGSDDFDPFS